MATPAQHVPVSVHSLDFVSSAVPDPAAADTDVDADAVATQCAVCGSSFPCVGLGQVEETAAPAAASQSTTGAGAGASTAPPDVIILPDGLQCPSVCACVCACVCVCVRVCVHVRVWYPRGILLALRCVHVLLTTRGMLCVYALLSGHLQCTFNNKLDATKCEVCQVALTSKPSSSTNANDVNNAVRGVEESKSEGKVMCQTCTVYNPLSATTCGTCGQPLKGGGGSGGGTSSATAGADMWHCETCTYANSASRTVCEICTSARPRSLPAPASLRGGSDPVVGAAAALVDLSGASSGTPAGTATGTQATDQQAAAPVEDPVEVARREAVAAKQVRPRCSLLDAPLYRYLVLTCHGLWSATRPGRGVSCTRRAVAVGVRSSVRGVGSVGHHLRSPLPAVFASHHGYVAAPVHAAAFHRASSTPLVCVCGVCRRHRLLHDGV